MDTQVQHKITVNTVRFFLLLILVSGYPNLVAQNEIQLAQPEETREMQYDQAFAEGLRYRMLGNPVEAGKYFNKCLELFKDRSAPYYELAGISIQLKDQLLAEEYIREAVRLNPDNKWFQLMFVRILLASQRYQEAAAVYEQLFSQFPENTDYLSAEIDLLTRAGEYKTVIRKLKSLEKIDGYEGEAALRLKDVLLLSGEDKKAIRVMRELADTYPEKIEYRGILAELLVEKGFEKEAMKEFNSIKEADPSNPVVHFSMGQYYLDKGDAHQAAQEFETGFKSRQVNPDVKFNVFMELMKANKKEDLNEDLLRLLTILYDTDKGHPGIDGMYANYLYDQLEYEKAEEIYKRLIETNPGDFLSWQNLLFIQNEQLDFDEMYSISQEAIKAFPNQTLFYLFRGIAGNVKGEYAESVEVLKKGMRLNTGNAELTKQYYISLGDALYHLGNHDEAFRNYDLLLVLDADNAIVLNNYAYYLSVLNRKIDKANEMITKCLALEPDNPTYLDTQAWVLYRMEQYEEALEIIQKVIDLEGQEVSGEVMEHYGDILFKNGLINEALGAWEKAKEIGDTSDEIDKKIENKGFE